MQWPCGVGMLSVILVPFVGEFPKFVVQTKYFSFTSKKNFKKIIIGIQDDSSVQSCLVTEIQSVKI